MYDSPAKRGMGFQPMNHWQDADATKPHGQDARATFHTRSERTGEVPLSGWQPQGRKALGMAGY